MFNLEDLIAPLSLDEFLDTYWNKRAVYLSGNGSDRFKDLYGWKEINEVLNFSRPGLQNVTLIIDRHKKDAGSVPDIMGELVKGASLNINGVNEIDALIANVSEMLSAELNARVTINCYASYPSKQGFDNHYDGHDVFILHTEGEKAWKVFEPTLEAMAHDRDKRRSPPPESDPYLEVDLLPGDVLYIPRGNWHYALATTPSVHLTVGVQPRTASDYLMWLSQRAMDNDLFLRQEMPVARLAALGGERPDIEFDVYLEQLARRLHEIHGNPAVLKESVLQFLMQDNPVRRKFQLPEASLLPVEITRQTRFRMHPAQKYLVRYDPDNNSGLLLFRGQSITLNNVPIDIVEGLLRSAKESVSGDELLVADSQVAWEPVRQLLVNLTVGGLLQIDSPEQPESN